MKRKQAFYEVGGGKFAQEAQQLFEQMTDEWKYSENQLTVNGL